jgi:hypothetical protein
MAVEAAEATESLPKEAGLVGLDGPLDELDLTKMLVENFENNGPEETSPSGDAVEEAEPVEESTEEAGDTGPLKGPTPTWWRTTRMLLTSPRAASFPWRQLTPSVSVGGGFDYKLKVAKFISRLVKDANLHD